MAYMVVTLDVSKLSGWLNADASCRVERRACDVGRGAAREREGVGRGAGAAAGWERREGVVFGGGSGMHGEGPTQGWARAEHTKNIEPMVVTLDVSKLSGWSNVSAFCRVERRECDVGRGAAREV